MGRGRLHYGIKSLLVTRSILLTTHHSQSLSIHPHSAEGQTFPPPNNHKSSMIRHRSAGRSRRAAIPSPSRCSTAWTSFYPGPAELKAAIFPLMAMRVLATSGFLCVWHIHAFLTPSRTTYRCCPTEFLMAMGGLNSQNQKVATTTTESADLLLLLPQLYTFQKPRQKRSATRRPRKPRYYWQSHDNLMRELHLFWKELNVKVNPDLPPPIPSEYLLNHFDRNDLRWGISQMGGRDNVSHMLGGAKIIPGKWRDAIELVEVRKILPQIMQQGSKNSSIAGLQHISQNSTDIVASMPLVTPALENNKHNNLTRIPRKEFWSKDKAIKEL